MLVISYSFFISLNVYFTSGITTLSKMRKSPIITSFKINTLYCGCDILTQSFRFLIQRSLCILIAYHL